MDVGGGGEERRVGDAQFVGLIWRLALRGRRAGMAGDGQRGENMARAVDVGGCWRPCLVLRMRAAPPGGPIACRGFPIGMRRARPGPRKRACPAWRPDRVPGIPDRDAPCPGPRKRA